MAAALLGRRGRVRAGCADSATAAGAVSRRRAGARSALPRSGLEAFGAQRFAHRRALGHAGQELLLMRQAARIERHVPAPARHHEQVGIGGGEVGTGEVIAPPP